jgi:AcrR family transcriptional regulator
VATRQNASTARTRRRLHDACLRLAESQDIRTLTVNQVAEEAGLNRTTFYLHYPDAETLIEAVVEELLDRLDEGGRRLLDWDATSMVEWEETFFRTIAEHHRLFMRMLAGSRDDALVRRFLTAIETGTIDIWKRNGLIDDADPVYVAMRAKFTASGVVGMTVGWLEAEMPVDAEQICRWNWEFVMALGAAIQPGENRMDPSIAGIPSDPGDPALHA